MSPIKLNNLEPKFFREHSGAKTAFGVQMVMTYLNTVFLSISWILAERKPDDSPDGNAFLLPPFSIMAFTMLAYLSYFGEELLKAVSINNDSKTFNLKPINFLGSGCNARCGWT